MATMSTILQFGAQFQPIERAIEYLRGRSILKRNPPLCWRDDCQRIMKEVKDATRADGYVWRCPRHKGVKKSIRADSFIENSKLSLDQFIFLVYFWALDIPCRAQTKLVGVNKETTIQWNQNFRDICSRWLVAHPIKLGGEGQKVEINVSLIAKRKYNRGPAVPEKWVFGLYDVSRKIGILQLVAERNRETLLPIIERTVAPGSIIYSDSWAAYGGGVIAALPVIPPYEHHTVSRSENFVDPISGACTYHIESFWKRANAKNKAMNGTSAEMVPSYLAEFMWRQQYGTEAYDNLLMQIATFYNVN